MNSYPIELLAQLCPVMFVAGLDVHQNVLDDLPHVQDPFSLLAIRLRDALTTRKQSVFQPKHPIPFHVHLVDKYVRFPPRKLVPQDDSTAHSPLSPLTPTSPLFPDGLIAPIWIRKHTLLVPSVFVLFLRLFELPPVTQRSPLDHPDPERDRERADEERRKDAELAAEIALRKKTTNERGIKLTAVLLATRRMLDDPTLDNRLTYIRRQSGLDSRAALFVLSPVSQSELGDFVQSLQQALYEPAIDYYTAHSKRVRRKRNRHAQTVTNIPMPISPHGAPPPARPLRPEGWTVRYEYKMACFAEFRGEDEVALKHFQDAYATLTEMFSSTAVLPPRTKRWAEAKVLADCINVKISKLYLYNNEHALALAHHNTHIHRFADLSRGWGIGEETFEYWSWMARQYRVFAELLEQGTRSDLVIPTHRPLPPQPPSVSQSALVGAKAEPMVNASHALQHPGYYYYMAAKCTEMRRERFLAALETQVAQNAPGFANEKKVDHLTVVLELYTKSYELFKQYSPVNAQNQNQGRLTLWIAYRIAQTYYAAGKYDMAVRFYERIAKTYRRERWTQMLRPLLSTWYACAQQLGDVELSIRLLVEMLSHGAQEGEDESTLEEDLLAVLKSTVPASPEPLVVDLSEAQPLFDVTVVFWTTEVVVGEHGAFQVILRAPENMVMSVLPIASLELIFSGDLRSRRINHIEDTDDAGRGLETVRKVELGHVDEHVANDAETMDVHEYLRWRRGDVVVFCGTVSSHVPCSLTISRLVLTLKQDSWVVEIPFDSSGIRTGMYHRPCWLSKLNPPRFIPFKCPDRSTLHVRHRPHRVGVELEHHSPAYLDEEYPISICVTNTDSCALDIVLDVLLQPSEIDLAVNSIILDDERSGSLIRGVSLGLVHPGVKVVKTLYLLSAGAPGERTVDISVRSSPAGITGEGIMGQEGADISETLRTLVVPTVEPIKMVFNVTYWRALSTRTGLADLRAFDSTYQDGGEGCEAVVEACVQCMGPWEILVDSMIMVKEAGPHAKVIEHFLESAQEESIFPAVYMAGDEFNDICRISLTGEVGQASQIPVTGIGEYLITWRKIAPDGEPGSPAVSRFPLPSLRPPTDGLVALLSVPPTAKLHTPISMHLTIRNNHPTRSANVTVQLELDPTDGFVVSGLRNGRVSILLPGAEQRLTWRLIPVECGHVAVPRLKVVDRRKAIANAQSVSGSEGELEVEGDVVEVVDVRDEAGTAVGPEAGNGACTVMVLP